MEQKANGLIDFCIVHTIKYINPLYLDMRKIIQVTSSLKQKFYYKIPQLRTNIQRLYLPQT